MDATTLAALAIAAAAQPEFVTIGDPGNPAFAGNPLDDERQFLGKGRVDYEYRIGRTELTWGDWLGFRDAVQASGVAIPNLAGGRYYGNLPFGGDLVVPGSTFNDLPVAGLNWRSAAAYCNWLHNNKSLEPQAFLFGAYDFAAFGFDQSTDTYSDQPTRSPGARFWIPSTDEWLKAVHYDPDRHGDGAGGWWTYPNGSDTRPVTGLPGEGETNANLFADIGATAWDIAVGAYPDTQTPWGLLDATGGVSEWQEDWLFPEDPSDRVVDGSSIDGTRSPDLDDHNFVVDFDRVGRGPAARRPDSGGRTYGIRIAAAIPTPATIAPLTAIALITARRRRT
ncbi:MAG: SUMF1/EgtB/PvdO family nonheme iron enzyme [Planctomycetota bacterium]